MNKRNVMIIISVFAFIAIIGGISYAYFVYDKDVGTFTLNAGDISINYSNVSSNGSLVSVIPLTDTMGMASTDYIDFTVDSTVDTERIYYEVYILPKSGNNLDTSYLKTYLTDQSDNELKGIFIYDDLVDSEVENGKVIYKGIIELNNNQTTKNDSIDFRLRLWLDDRYTEVTSKTFQFDIYLYAKNVSSDYIIGGVNLVRASIENKKIAASNACDPTFVKNGMVYFTGNSTCVDMNYVWYSGKLWRITAIYPDGAMKLVTQDNITTISFNESGNPTFKDNNTSSYMYQWLNEDFYDTLYRPTDFIDTTKEWDVTETTSISADPGGTSTVAANVGLLNSFEYYNSYRCIGNATCTGNGYATGYLNTSYYWKLLNPYSSTVVWQVNSSGSTYTGADTNTAQGVRPSIVLKTGVEFKGNGTISSPYLIVGDKSVGRVNDPINTRLSGEYVLLKNGNNEELFRIIGIENNKTKVIAMNYADSSGTRRFANSSVGTLWGSGTTTDTGTWYDYLKNTYLPNLRSTYGDIFDSGTYYLGTTGYNYKLAVCASATSDTTKTCTKTTDTLPNSSNTDPVYVGLPRYGEMFAAQEGEGYSTSVNIWLINRYSSSLVWNAAQYGNASSLNATNQFGARPTVHLKNNVVIKSGSGTKSDPYVI